MRKFKVSWEYFHPVYAKEPFLDRRSFTVNAPTWYEAVQRVEEEQGLFLGRTDYKVEEVKE